MAKALGLDAVAEGIESKEQAECLVELGYRCGQGFHLLPPKHTDELDDILSRR
jgi:EAL domain-containing protein (putative c-di-GMP-specific phosphodiesterase class I)